MTGMTDFTATKALGHITGKTTWTIATPTWLGLFSAAPTDAGVFTGEVPNGGATNAYVRVTTSGAWGSPSAGGTSASSITNSSAISFPAATGSGATGWGTINSWGLFDSATVGAGNSNLLFWDYLGNFSWIPYTNSTANPGVFTSPGHGFANGDAIIISSEYGGSPPTTSSAGGIIAPAAGLIVAGVTTDTFTLTNAGTAIVTTSTGDGTLRKIAPQGIAAGVTASFAIGTLTLSQA